MAYKDVYAAAQADPEAFWLEAAKAIDWVTPPTKALFDENAPLYEWFADGRLNGCWNTVDRHVEAGHGDRLAIIHDSPVTQSVTKITFAELKEKTARLGGALAARGVGKGDRVIV
ncbi:MAG: acetyl-coenzyme A synthetase N-terminal domain-containing protein, partial [Pseudomonadota bacterium]